MLRRIYSLSLATQVLIGFIVGVASGVFFGDLIAPLGIAGDAFIGLLQMTVLPYVFVSLILGIGRLSSGNAGILIKHSMILLGVLWLVALSFIVIMPLAYPQVESGSYFSTSLVEPSPKFDFINLFVPANPFGSLATGTVPAVVVFSLAVGAALIGIEKKRPILEALDTISTSLSRVSKFIARLSPIGVFAITARAAGTLDVAELQSLEVYFATYLVFWFALAIWFLPMFATAFLPLKYREVMGPARDALVTAFATGSVFVVLPLLADHAKVLVRKCAPESEDAPGAVDVLIPLAFAFPGPGEILILGFIVFASWLSGVAISLSQWPGFLISGLFSKFGSSMVAIPFLLDQLRIPSDLFQLYVVANVFTGRFGMVASGAFILMFGAVSACSLAGTLKVRKNRLIVLAAGTIAIVFVGVLGVRLFFGGVARGDSETDDFMSRELMVPSALQVTELDAEQAQSSLDGPEAALQRIRSRGTLRVGYRDQRLPFSFRNSSGQLVGYDIDLAHLLANDLGVKLELVAIEASRGAELLSTGAVDIVMSGAVVTPERALEVEFTKPYLEETVAFIVRDHRRNEFMTGESIKKLKGMRLAVPNNLPHLRDSIQPFLTDPRIELVDSPQDFFTAEGDSYDALLFSAEAGSALTLLNPEFAVVVPQPTIHRVPVAFPVAPGDDRMRTFLNTWIDLKRTDNTLSNLSDYWILGKSNQPTALRWCVIRDVLHWVD
jgi:Na+/H+-dicarboxylate symporter/ABC-type amino acid transport substrate-binding protein